MDMQLRNPDLKKQKTCTKKLRQLGAPSRSSISLLALLINQFFTSKFVERFYSYSANITRTVNLKRTQMQNQQETYKKEHEQEKQWFDTSFHYVLWIIDATC